MIEVSCSDQEMSSKTTETCSSSTAWWWRRRMRILCSILARQVQVQLVASDWPMLISRDDHGPVQPYFASCYIIYLIRPAPISTETPIYRCWWRVGSDWSTFYSPSGTITTQTLRRVINTKILAYIIKKVLIIEPHAELINDHWLLVTGGSRL